MSSISAERVRKYRRVRIDAGQVEVKAWILEADKEAARQALAPFVKAAGVDRFMRGQHGPNWRRSAWLRQVGDTLMMAP